MSFSTMTVTQESAFGGRVSDEDILGLLDDGGNRIRVDRLASELGGDDDGDFFRQQLKSPLPNDYDDDGGGEWSDTGSKLGGDDDDIFRQFEKLIGECTPSHLDGSSCVPGTAAPHDGDGLMLDAAPSLEADLAVAPVLAPPPAPHAAQLLAKAGCTAWLGGSTGEQADYVLLCIAAEIHKTLVPAGATGVDALTLAATVVQASFPQVNFPARAMAGVPATAAATTTSPRKRSWRLGGYDGETAAQLLLLGYCVFAVASAMRVDRTHVARVLKRLQADPAYNPRDCTPEEVQKAESILEEYLACDVAHYSGFSGLVKTADRTFWFYSTAGDAAGAAAVVTVTPWVSAPRPTSERGLRRKELVASQGKKAVIKVAHTLQAAGETTPAGKVFVSMVRYALANAEEATTAAQDATTAAPAACAAKAPPRKRNGSALESTKGGDHKRPQVQADDVIEDEDDDATEDE
jgi:hypothetical protein